MRFALTDEQHLLQESVRGALQRSSKPAHVRAWAESGDLAEFDTLAERQGWMGISISEAEGGQGGGLVELAVLFEELGRAAAPSGRLLARLGGVVGVAEHLGDAETPLAESVAADSSIIVATSAAVPLEHPAPVIERDGRLTGRIELVLDAPGSTRFLVLVPDQRHGAVSVWLVDAGDSGLRVQTRHMLDRTRRFGDVELDGVTGELVGTVDDVEAVAARISVLLAAESLGLARGMVEMTTAYVGDRVQFGVPVGSFQAVKHALAQAYVDVEAAHSGVYYAAWAVDNREIDAPARAWIAKAFATETAASVADCALRLHGAVGYTWEHDLHLLFKRAKLNVQLYGAPGTYWDRVADTLNLEPSPDETSRPAEQDGFRIEAQTR